MDVKYNFKKDELLSGIQPKQMGLELTSVQRIDLSESLQLKSHDNELCLVCIAGEFEFKIDAFKGTSVFKDMLYVPRHQTISLDSQNASIIVYSAPSEIDSEFVHIKFTEVDQDSKRHKIYGSQEKNTLRHVWDFIDDDFKASRLMVGLCEGETGGWTAWPPHEHAEKREEVYVYFNMKDAFGVQLVYDEDMNHPLIVSLVRDGDLVSVPKGYHPSVGCPAGKMSYIYCMAAKISGDRNFMDLQIQKVYEDKFE